TQNDVYLMASSGTGGMEASVCNLLSAGDKAITVEGGKFGERWTEICQAFGVQTHVIKVEWGQSVQAQQIKKVLDQDKTIKAVFITHCETSTGVTTDIKAIGQVVKNTNAVLVVDAVSSLGVIDLKTDEWNVDIVASASHKGFMLPPGLAFASVSPKAWKLIGTCKTPRYYFDFRKAKEAWGDTDTAFTPAISIVIGLTESLKRMKKMGLEPLFAYFARLAQGTRVAAKALGLKVFPQDNCVSNVLTAIVLPAQIDGNKLVKTMRDKYGVTVAGGQGQLKGKVVRFAHMGCLTEKDLIEGIACFEKVLQEMGYSFPAGSGVQAAQKFFEQPAVAV
ncbi:MAG: alanine--glyoxylate aminotransferase family protein, partial [Candidatus Omnitrophota bacterium]|nr:alanine--glyoxylate aminotransferase family protein [Candidatus Omnitrophota bacterium]